MTRILTAIAFSIFGIFPTLFSPSSASGESSETLTIGSILILSGEGAAWGNVSKNGIDLAVDDLNSAGGVLGKKFAVLHQDDQGDPKKSLSAFQQLTSGSGVKFIIGPNWSTLGLPLVEPARRQKVMIISPSLGMAKFNESHELLFNSWPHDNVLSEQLADYVYQFASIIALMLKVRALDEPGEKSSGRL